MYALTALIASLSSSVKDIKGSVDSMQSQVQEQSTKIAALTDNAVPAHEVQTASDSSSIISTAIHRILKTRGKPMQTYHRQSMLHATKAVESILAYDADDWNLVHPKKQSKIPVHDVDQKA